MRKIGVYSKFAIESKTLKGFAAGYYRCFQVLCQKEKNGQNHNKLMPHPFSLVMSPSFALDRYERCAMPMGKILTCWIRGSSPILIKTTSGLVYLLLLIHDRIEIIFFYISFAHDT